MWRMIRAAVIGVVLGVVGGAIIGQLYYMNFLRNNREKKAVNALVYSNEMKYEDAENINNNNIIRLVVFYNGDDITSEAKKKEMTEAVKSSVMYALSERLGENYSEKMTFQEVKHEIIMAYEYINKCANECAIEYGVDGNSASRLEYLYFGKQICDGITLPAGNYETLSITIND